MENAQLLRLDATEAAVLPAERRLRPTPLASSLRSSEQETAEHTTRVLQAAVIHAERSSHETTQAPISATAHSRSRTDRIELEKIRVRVEAARAHASGSVAGIPTGRVYDTVPDDGNEAAYDALEKAYNAAFYECSPERLERSELPDKALASAWKPDSHENDQEFSLAGFAQFRDRILRAKAAAIDQVSLKGAQSDLARWKRDQAEAKQRRVEQLAQLKLAELDLPTIPATERQEFAAFPAKRKSEYLWQHRVVRGRSSVVDHGNSVHVRRVEKRRRLRQLASACQHYVSVQKSKQVVPEDVTSSPAVQPLSVKTEVEPVPPSSPVRSSPPPPSPPLESEPVEAVTPVLASPPQLPPSSPLPSPPPIVMEERVVKVEVSPAKPIPAQPSTLIVAEELQDEAPMTLCVVRPFGRIVAEERKVLNQFLVAELQSYSNLLLGKVIGEAFPVTHDLAKATSAQLYWDHRCALSDFDADWKRSKTVSYHSAHCLQENPATDDSQTERLSINPFCKSDNQASSRWQALLENVRSFPGAKPQENRPPVEKIGQLEVLYQRGANGLIISNIHTRAEQQNKIARSLTQLVQSKNSNSFLHLVVVSTSDIPTWKVALSNEHRVGVIPYWGERSDRDMLRSLFKSDSFFGPETTTRVVLTSFDIFAEDLALLGSTQWQCTLFDLPHTNESLDQGIEPFWLRLISLRSRQRLLICPENVRVDVRKLIHFICPALFPTRRKMMAWTCAAFDQDSIQTLCDVVRLFIVESHAGICSSFMEKVKTTSAVRSEKEAATLSSLNKQGVLTVNTRSYDWRKVPVKEKHERSKPQMKIIVNSTGTSVKRPALPKGSDSESKKSISLPKVIIPKKRRSGDGTPRSRKRISRCGECAGCLSDDCMICGHCKDMKKYGGPGLRKQSCKNRKCINPRSWGLSTKRRRKSKSQKQSEDSHPHDDDMGTDRDDSDVDSMLLDDMDDASVAYYSVDSDHDSTFSGSHLAYADDSDDGDVSMDSPRDTSLLLHHDDNMNGLLSTLSPPLDANGRSSRTRVMRCSKCAGCRAPDCMKCRHCLDMKKYGGPGLRKQSCKSRKCIAPKIVLLNQGKDDEEFVDEKGNVVAYYEHGDGGVDYYDFPELMERQTETVTRQINLSLSQECELSVAPYLPFGCATCVARFSSRDVLDLHEAAQHATALEAGKLSALEYEAVELFSHPIYQLALIAAQHRERHQAFRVSPRGYAKLEGREFQFYLIEPCVVLGRMSSRWRHFYQDRLGLSKLKGLPAGEGLDCHVGSDKSIARQHALIVWNSVQSCFTVECLSLRSPITVNGHCVSFGSSPVALRSRNLIQIGACAFNFLLPKISTEPAPLHEEKIPRAEVRAWMHAAVKKRRAEMQRNAQLASAVQAAVVQTREP